LLFTKFDGFIIKLSQYIEKHNIKFGVQELRIPSKSGKLFNIMSYVYCTLLLIRIISYNCF